MQCGWFKAHFLVYFWDKKPEAVKGKTAVDRKCGPARLTEDALWVTCGHGGYHIKNTGGQEALELSWGCQQGTVRIGSQHGELHGPWLSGWMHASACNSRNAQSWLKPSFSSFLMKQVRTATRQASSKPNQWRFQTFSVFTSYSSRSNRQPRSTSVCVPWNSPPAATKHHHRSSINLPATTTQAQINTSRPLRKAITNPSKPFVLSKLSKLQSSRSSFLLPGPHH